MRKNVPVLAACAFLLGCTESGGGTSGTQGPREMFAFPVRFSLGSGFPARLVRADLDADGIADLVVPLSDFSGSAIVSTVVLLYLDRNGQPVRTVGLTDARQPMDAAITDCDGDGRVDLLVLDRHGEVLVYLQQVDESFGAPFPFAVGEEPFRLFVARWDGDGVDDLLTVNEEGQSVCVLPGRGDGTFEPGRFTTFQAFGLRDAAVGDLDRDGALDVALITFSGGFTLSGLGNGRFEIGRAHV